VEQYVYPHKTIVSAS